MTSALFCDECGAALPAQATPCAICRHSFAAASPGPAVQVVNASLPPPLAASPGALRPGLLFARRYRILEKVGEGGFGVTYKAEDLDHHRWLVAIKQITLSRLSPREMIEATDTFNREVAYLSRLKHASIPRIYDSFTDAGHWYLVMDYIAGETLEDQLHKKRRGRVCARAVYDIGIALCEVLGYLHVQHPPIIFRDVKPANIMQTPTGRLYLIDFGIARTSSPGQSRDTAPLGSPAYAAPEQYGKAQTTIQTDIYGLGATLQTLLTGKDPLELAISGEQHRRKIKRRVPSKLRPLLEQMLERDASKRPQSMDEVKQSLQWLKEHTAGYRVRRALAFIWDFLIHSSFEVLVFVALLLLIYFALFFTGFFSSTFWIPCLLVMLCVVGGRSAYYLHQAREEAARRLKATEALRVVVKRLKGSILFALIPAIFFYYLYDSQMTDSPLSTVDNLFLGGVILFFLVCGLCLFNREIRWLLHPVTARWRARKPGQVPPLQQQMRKRP